MLLLSDIDFYDLDRTAQEIGKICEPFLSPRGFSYFQFKRVYKDSSYVILANRAEFFKDFLEKELSELFDHVPFYTRQSAIYYWDDFGRANPFTLIKSQKKVYHAITFIYRRKNFYDCTTVARSEPHRLPSSYYFYHLKELQKFVEIFPVLAQNLIEKFRKTTPVSSTTSGNVKRKGLFLPKRSTRFPIGEGARDYITTYEAFCLQLLQEGKSYKEIGSVLSVSPNTVETHLERLKERTGRTFRELTLQPLQTFHGKKKPDYH
jgi:DNA-binding CsgD family transcriptional regulator